VNDKYIAQASTQEEAIIKGLNALGITKDEAIISVEEPGKKGFLGIGQKDAVVIVERKEKINVVDEFLSSEFEMERAEETTPASQPKQEAKAEPEPKATAQPKQETQTEPQVEEAARPDETLEDPKEAEAKEQEDEMSNEELSAGREQAEVEIVGENKQQQTVEEKTTEAEEPSEPTESEVYDKDQAAIEEVREYLKDIIVAMGVEDVDVYTSRVKNNVKYDIETENAGLVIGRHGKVLNGLQTLAQNHMHQLAYSKINVRADAEKYRERRKNTVENLANRTAQKVLKQNRAVKLDPMPAHERKQIHRYLNGNPKIKTHSEGREPKRYLVVEPNNS
jgi:spoIIIJ-associated protein